MAKRKLSAAESKAFKTITSKFPKGRKSRRKPKEGSWLGSPYGEQDPDFGDPRAHQIEMDRVQASRAREAKYGHDPHSSGDFPGRYGPGWVQPQESLKRYAGWAHDPARGTKYWQPSLPIDRANRNLSPHQFKQSPN